MDTSQLIQSVDRPLGGISLLDLQGLRGQLAASRTEHEERLAGLEAKRDALFVDGASRPDGRGQHARARQVAALEDEANQVVALLRVAHKQLLLLDRLIWLRESLDAIERLRQDVTAAVPIDWQALVAATEPFDDEEARLDQLNDALESADRRAAEEGRPRPRPQSAAGSAAGQDRPVPAVSRAAAAQPSTLLVVRVFDGATIELANGQRVRYIGVDSPQMRNALGKTDAGALEARDANRSLVGHKRVRLEADQLDTDADGALWRYVFVGDTLVNAELLRQGAVYYASRYPNNRLAEILLEAEQAARRHQRGLWKPTD